MNHRPAFCLVAGAIMLSACGSDAPSEETEAEAGRGAKGEVMGGTISDAMIPLDQLKSKSPHITEEPTPPSTGDAGNGDAAAEADADPADGGAEPAPAESEEPGEPAED